MPASTTSPDIPAKTVKCPSCKGLNVYASSNPYRPFCGERCKNHDFGAWASESFRMATQAPPDAMDEPQERVLH